MPQGRSQAHDVAHRTRRRRRLAAVGAASLPLLLGGCQLPTFYGYRGQTSQAHDEFLLYAGTVIAAIVVGVITGGLILWSVVRYRRRSDAMPRQFQYHIPLEIFYTAVPIVIVLVLFGFTVFTENKVDNVSPTPAVAVKVTAFQWGWRFDYTNQRVFVQGVRTDNPDPVGLNGSTCTASAPTPNDCLGPGLVLPVGQTVRITLVSNDVVHGFYVPQFNFSRYALPGVTNRFDFNVARPGIYRAQCTQLCGLYHAQMFFHVVALPPAQFDAWVTGSQPQPDQGTVAQPAVGTGGTSGAPASATLPTGATGAAASPSSAAGGASSGGAPTGPAGTAPTASSPARTTPPAGSAGAARTTPSTASTAP
ncbi:MAG: hypothetical protein M0013_04835 [Actinomycetota bacterium]|jgi:cytochrome c oxidase subunit 2|nr:hypothetical protein [Actinomycetota bacterium]